MDELPAKMTSMVEHQSAKGCFRENGREPGGYDYVIVIQHLHDEDDKLTMHCNGGMMMKMIPLARSSLTARQQRAAWARSK